MPIAQPLLPTDELVMLAYRGPLETSPWGGFLDALSRRMGARAAAMVLRLSREGRPPLIVWGRRPDVSAAEARQIQRTHAELGHLDPLRNALATPGSIHTLDEVVDRETLEANPFYQRVLKPYGLERMIGMYLSEPGGWEGNVGVTNGAEAADFGDDDKAMLSALRPHLELSLAIFAQISREETELRALTDTLDRLTISTLILNGTGAVIRTNSAARRMLTAREVAYERDGRIGLADRQANAEFQDILATALMARRTRQQRPFVQAMRSETASDRHVGILIRSIDHLSLYTSDSGPALIIYVSGGRAAQPLERLVTQLFDLTPSEAHLATLLATGSSLAEAAGKLDLTENTVRTYSKTIMNKMGVHRQADLIRLVLRSVAVLG